MRTLKHASIDRFDNINRNQGVITENCYNFKNTSVLKADKGIKNASFPEQAGETDNYSLDFESANVTSVKGLGLFRQYIASDQKFDYRIIMFSGTGNLYFHTLLSNNDNVNSLYNLQMTGTPAFFAYKNNGLDSLVMVDSTKMILWTTGQLPVTYTGLPEVTSLCVFNNQMYCSVKYPAYKIWHSTALDPNNVGTTGTTAEYIEFDESLGDVNKVLVLNENLYAIMEYGIFKLEKDENSWVITRIYESNTKIFPNTVAVAGTRLIFLTKDGLYQFNGYTVTRININFKEYLDDINANVVGACLGSDYYLALKHNFDDGQTVLCESGTYTNNIILTIDLDELTYQVMRGMDVKTFLPIKTEEFEKMVICFNSYDSSYIGEITNASTCFNHDFPKFWSSGSLIESKAKKLATSLVVDASKGVKITLICDGKRREFTTTQDGVSKFDFKITGKDFRVEIFSLQDEANVSSLTLDYYEN